MKDYIIETHALKKQYGTQTVVNSVGLHVSKGRIYGLLGRNGAGKTSIMKMLLGLTSVTSGGIRLFGEELADGKDAVYSRCGSIVETPSFYPTLTGTENLQVFARLRGTIKKDAVRDALAMVNLPMGDKKPFSSYSLGMKQRLGIANAILNDPELLILDEPTNGLDPIGIAEIRAYLRSLSRDYGKTILISSHILSEIALMADDIGIIHEGSLLEEIPLAELESKNEKYIHIEVSDTALSARILEREMGISAFSIGADSTIRIYGEGMVTSEVNRSLVEGGVSVSSLSVYNASLEDYFKKITGGVGIA